MRFILYTYPIVINNDNDRERQVDIFSCLLQNRIIMLTGEINDAIATLVVSQLLYLDSISNDDIQIYINSHGGSIQSGFAIYDTMKYIKSDVSTICVGSAYSMGAFLLAGGTKGKRFSLPNSEIMIHQPLGGFSGQVTDVEIYSERLMKSKKKMNEMMSVFTKKAYEEIKQMTERDNFLSAEESLEIGIIDKVITS